jgi:aminomethyltransferase
MKKTSLYTTHINLGAKLVPFAGYEMPIEYSGITTEHLQVRNSVGIFDVSHMGEFWVTGPNALVFLQKITTNDVSALINGQAQYTCFPNGNGGIIDDLLIYKVDTERYLLVVNAANIEKDWHWCIKNNNVKANLSNVSDSISQFAVQGPKAIKALQKLTTLNLSDISYYHFTIGTIAGINNIIISNTGYTGAGGFELYVDNQMAQQLWNAILQTGEEFNILPIGLGARDTLRLEMGYCLYGNDIDETTSPIEAGLGWITKFKEGKDFIDKEYLLGQKNSGTNKILRGFKMIDKGIPRSGYDILDVDENIIGKVTSGTHSPILKGGIGLGYINTKHSKIGTPIFIKVRNHILKAKVVKVPFIY